MLSQTHHLKDSRRDSVLKEPSQLLVIDDEHGICDVLTIGLEREGYAVTVAHDGKEALARISGKRFDLILLDLKLPDISGLELLAQ